MRRITKAEQNAEREAFQAEQRALELREKFWLGFTAGAAVQGVALIGVRLWLG